MSFPPPIRINIFDLSYEIIHGFGLKIDDTQEYFYDYNEKIIISFCINNKINMNNKNAIANQSQIRDIDDLDLSEAVDESITKESKENEVSQIYFCKCPLTIVILERLLSKY